MSLNFDGIRKKCARRLYENTMQEQFGNKPWFSLEEVVRIGFERMASEVFDVLFKEDPKEVVRFFTGLEIKIVQKDEEKVEKK